MHYLKVLFFCRWVCWVRHCPDYLSWHLKKQTRMFRFVFKNMFSTSFKTIWFKKCCSLISFGPFHFEPVTKKINRIWRHIYAVIYLGSLNVTFSKPSYVLTSNGFILDQTLATRNNPLSKCNKIFNYFNVQGLSQNSVDKCWYSVNRRHRTTKLVSKRVIVISLKIMVWY